MAMPSLPSSIARCTAQAPVFAPGHAGRAATGESTSREERIGRRCTLLMRGSDADAAQGRLAKREREMSKRFAIGDHVGWNSEAGRVSGTVIAVHNADFDYKGHVRHASEDDPQYEIKSDKTDHVAAHKGGALHRL
jgi:hypothetical protein